MVQQNETWRNQGFILKVNWAKTGSKTNQTTHCRKQHQNSNYGYNKKSNGPNGD